MELLASAPASPLYVLLLLASITSLVGLLWNACMNQYLTVLRHGLMKTLLKLLYRATVYLCLTALMMP
jgi:hypothetical protein